ncbi:MAG TPA: hypothetical protein VHE30_01625 [Polyangiaceae bacterium]|nr:hypothetical protein [Polyangiaceae bacterium]
MRFLRLSPVLPLLATTGCAMSAHTMIQNPPTSTTSYNVAVTVWKDQRSQPVRTELGSIPPGGSVSNDVKVKKGGTITMEAALPGSATVWSVPHTVAPNERSPLQLVGVVVPTGRAPQTLTVAQIAAKLPDLDRGRGVGPVPVADALKSLLGAACVLTLEPGKPAEVHLCFTSAELNDQVQPADFQAAYRHAQDHVEFEASATAAAGLGAEIGLYEGLLAYEPSSFYRFSTDLTDFGAVTKPEATNFDLGSALGEARRDQVAKTLAAHPGAKLVYINHVWAVRSGKTDVFQAARLGVGARTTPNSILGPDGAYEFGPTPAASKSHAEQVFDFWGEERGVHSAKRGGGSAALVVTIQKEGTELRLADAKREVAQALLGPAAVSAPAAPPAPTPPPAAAAPPAPVPAPAPAYAAPGAAPPAPPRSSGPAPIHAP